MESPDRGAQTSEPIGSETSLNTGLGKLFTAVTSTLEQVQKIHDNLSEQYDDLGLSSLSTQFETISAQFSNYIVIRDEIRFAVHKSKDRLNATRRVVARAGKIAHMFEKYARHPQAYSRVQSRLNINILIGELKNLKAKSAGGKSIGHK